MIRITKSWANLLKDEFEKPYFKNLQKFLEEEYSKYDIYPDMSNIFNALNAVKYEEVKTLITSQVKHMGFHSRFKTESLCHLLL